MSVRLAVRVKPGARRSALTGRTADGTWQVAVRERPEAGRANRAVESLLARLIGVAARQVQVARGGTSRVKQVAVDGLDAAEVQRRLAAALTETESNDA